MRRVVAFVLVFLMVISVMPYSSSSATDSWGTSGGGFESDSLAGHVILDDGTMIVGGTYSTAISFDEIGVGAVGLLGDVDIYLAMSLPNGTWTSVYGFGSNGTDGLDAIALHPSGDVILLGHFCHNTAGLECEMNFTSSFTLTKENISNEGGAFLARLSYVGDTISPIWVRQIANEFRIEGFDLAISGDGSSITSGILFSNDLVIEDVAISAGEFNSLGLITYDQNGNLEWINQIDSAEAIEPFGGLCYSNSGHVNVVGTYLDTVIIGFPEFSNGGSDIFVAQLDSFGNNIWNAFAGSTGDDWATDCAVDSIGNVYITGQFEGTAQFGSINATSNGWWDMFIAKLDAGGIWTDVDNYGNSGWESIETILIDNRDEILVSGTHTDTFTLGMDELTEVDNNWIKRDIFVGQLDSQMEWLWAFSFGSEGDDTAVSIDLGVNQTPVIGFTFDGEVNAFNTTITTNGISDVGILNYARDYDLDGLTDGIDNCPRDANPQQVDTDSDMTGDMCDDDDDADGVVDSYDDCTPGEIGWVSSPDTDHDGDGCRDVTEDFDDDEDGIFDSYDTCPEGPVGWVSTVENDENQDGCEDVDSDGDGYVDQLDKCPSIFDDQSDLDGDGIGDACETDLDGDGIEDVEDNCPSDQFSWDSSVVTDLDEDGCRDSDRDSDDDGDGVLDLADDCPLGEPNWNESFDHDGDGCHDDIEDSDDDSDGFIDDSDSCPRGYIGIAGAGMDIDQDGCIDSTEDYDDDNDGVNDSIDECRYTREGIEVDAKGCSGLQLDDDGDGVHNLDDLCPATPPGQRVSSTGCVIETNDKTESKAESEDSSVLIWVLFSLAGLIVIIALYINFRPDKELPQSKTLVPVDSAVNNSGSEGQGSTTSANIVNSSLDTDAGDSQLATNES